MPVRNVGEDVEVARLSPPRGDLQSCQHRGIERADGQHRRLGVREAFDVELSVQFAHRQRQSMQVLLAALGHAVEVLRLPFGVVDDGRSASDQQLLDPVVVQHPLLRGMSSPRSFEASLTPASENSPRGLRLQGRQPGGHRLPGVEPVPVLGDRDVIRRARTRGAHLRLEPLSIHVNRSSHDPEITCHWSTIGQDADALAPRPSSATSDHQRGVVTTTPTSTRPSTRASDHQPDADQRRPTTPGPQAVTLSPT